MVTPRNPVDRNEGTTGTAQTGEVRSASPRRVGTETSRTRAQLLDCVEQLMLDKGYAAISYRAVAAKADVTAGTVQYYFPTLDDLFVATVRRRSEQGRQRLVEALQDRADQPLRTLWEYTKDETTSALVLEFMALANHRRSIRNEITDATTAASGGAARSADDQMERGGARRGRDRRRRAVAGRMAVPHDRCPDDDATRGGLRDHDRPRRPGVAVRDLPRLGRATCRRRGAEQRRAASRHCSHDAERSPEWATHGAALERCTTWVAHGCRARAVGCTASSRLAYPPAHPLKPIIGRTV